MKDQPLFDMRYPDVFSPYGGGNTPNPMRAPLTVPPAPFRRRSRSPPAPGRRRSRSPIAPSRRRRRSPSTRRSRSRSHRPPQSPSRSASIRSRATSPHRRSSHHRHESSQRQHRTGEVHPSTKAVDIIDTLKSHIAREKKPGENISSAVSTMLRRSTMYDLQANHISGDDLAAAVRRMNNMLAEADGCPPLRDPPLQTKVEVLLANLNQLAQQAPSSKLLAVLVENCSQLLRAITAVPDANTRISLADTWRQGCEMSLKDIKEPHETVKRKNDEVGLTGSCRKR